jgi:DNA-binding beta-propeller fold protein YncE
LDVDSGGRVYVSDFKTGQILVFNARLTPLFTIDDVGTPLGVAVDPKGQRIFVGRADNGSVEVYDGGGVLVGLLGGQENEFQMPNDLVATSDGRVLVADSKANAVKVYASDLTLQTTIGTQGTAPGELDFPSALALSTNEAELYVGDQGNHRIQVFALDGTFLRTFGGPLALGAFPGNFGRIQSIAVTDGGLQSDLIHVVDAGQNRVQILSASGVYLATYGTTGTQLGELNLPLDITATPAGHILACNTGNRRLEPIH